MLADWGKYLASQGYAVLSIDYRQSSDGPSFPENMQNVQAACDYLYDNAESMGIDRDRIGLLGASSGAHLAALAALTMASHPINVLILVYGVYDLSSHWQFEALRAGSGSVPLAERMMGFGPSDDPQRYENASPVRLAASKSTNAIRALIVWGCDDDVVSPSQSETFAAALANSGAAVRTLPVARAGHFWFSQESPSDAVSRTGAIAPKLLEFLGKNL